jgi:DNA modification methylase
VRQIKTATNLTSQQNAIEEIRNSSYPFDTSFALEKLLNGYKKNGRTRNVSFRKMVSWLKVGERATHYLHPYPAKLLPQIAHFFLASNILAPKGAKVLDPFGGTGTVALEAILSGRNALFSDVNPLARIIAKVKTTPLDAKIIERALARIENRYLTSINVSAPIPSVVNIDYWYDKKTIASLARLKASIKKERDSEIRDFMLVCFSATARRASKADPRLSVPVRSKEYSITSRRINAWDLFADQTLNNIKRMRSFWDKIKPDRRISAQLAGSDARALISPKALHLGEKTKLRANSIDLVITSPPYAGAQKYIRASSLSLGWLGLAGKDDLIPLERASIGREHFPTSTLIDCPITGIRAADKIIKRIHKINPLRGLIVATYINEMDASIKEVERVLKPGGYFILVIGNNEVCGLPFKSSDFLLSIGQKYGMELHLRMVDEIKSRGLMTKRNRSASVITREWVMLLRKPLKK